MLLLVAPFGALAAMQQSSRGYSAPCGQRKEFTMSNRPNPNPPDTTPSQEPGRQQPPAGDPVPMPPDQPGIAPPAEPVRKPPQYAVVIAR
jgi:hypothetical protein